MGANRKLKVTNRGEVLLYEGRANGSNKVTLRAPASLVADFILNLPTAQGGADTFLKNDGSGNLGWASQANSLQSAYDGGSTINTGSGSLDVKNDFNTKGPSPIVNVKHVDFGSVGDGVTDDLAALDLVTTYVATLPYGAKIYFPPGRYLINSSWVLSALSGKIHLCGAGMDSTYLLCSDSLVGIDITEAASETGLQISDMTIAGNTSQPADLVKIGAANTVGIRNVAFRSAKRLLSFSGGAISHGVVEGCIFGWGGTPPANAVAIYATEFGHLALIANSIEAGSAGTKGFFYEGSSSGNDLRAIGNSMNGIFDSFFELGSGGSGGTMQRCTLIGNSCEANTAGGIFGRQVGTIDHLTLIGNSADGGGGGGNAWGITGTVTNYVEIGNLFSNFTGQERIYSAAVALSGKHQIGPIDIEHFSKNSAKLGLKVEEVESGSALASLSGFIPAGCMVIGLAWKITETVVIAGGVNFDIGVSGALDRYNQNITTLIAGTSGTSLQATWGGTETGQRIYRSAANLDFTPDAGSVSSGKIRVALYYQDLTSPLT